MILRYNSGRSATKNNPRKAADRDWIGGTTATGRRREVGAVGWMGETARFFGFRDEAGGSAVLWAVAVWTVVPVEGARGGGGVEVYGGGQ